MISQPLSKSSSPTSTTARSARRIALQKLRRTRLFYSRLRSRLIQAPLKRRKNLLRQKQLNKNRLIRLNAKAKARGAHHFSDYPPRRFVRTTTTTAVLALRPAAMPAALAANRARKNVTLLVRRYRLTDSRSNITLLKYARKNRQATRKFTYLTRCHAPYYRPKFRKAFRAVRLTILRSSSALAANKRFNCRNRVLGGAERFRFSRKFFSFFAPTRLWTVSRRSQLIKILGQKYQRKPLKHTPRAMRFAEYRLRRRFKNKVKREKYRSRKNAGVQVSKRLTSAGIAKVRQKGRMIRRNRKRREVFKTQRAQNRARWKWRFGTVKRKLLFAKNQLLKATSLLKSPVVRRTSRKLSKKASKGIFYSRGQVRCFVRIAKTFRVKALLQKTRHRLQALRRVRRVKQRLTRAFRRRNLHKLVHRLKLLQKNKTLSSNQRKLFRFRKLPSSYSTHNSVAAVIPGYRLQNRHGARVCVWAHLISEKVRRSNLQGYSKQLQTVLRGPLHAAKSLSRFEIFSLTRAALRFRLRALRHRKQRFNRRKNRELCSKKSQLARRKFRQLRYLRRQQIRARQPLHRRLHSRFRYYLRARLRRAVRRRRAWLLVTRKRKRKRGRLKLRRRRHFRRKLVQKLRARRYSMRYRRQKWRYHRTLRFLARPRKLPRAVVWNHAPRRFLSLIRLPLFLRKLKKQLQKQKVSTLVKLKHPKSKHQQQKELKVRQKRLKAKKAQKLKEKNDPRKRLSIARRNRRRCLVRRWQTRQVYALWSRKFRRGKYDAVRNVQHRCTFAQRRYLLAKRAFDARRPSWGKPPRDPRQRRRRWGRRHAPRTGADLMFQRKTPVSWRRQWLPQWESEKASTNRIYRLLYSKNKKIKTWISRRLWATRYQLSGQNYSGRSRSYFALPFRGASTLFRVRLRVLKRPSNWRRWSRRARLPKILATLPGHTRRILVSQGLFVRRLVMSSQAQPTVRPIRPALSAGVTTNFACNNYSVELQQALSVAPDKILYSRQRDFQRTAQEYMESASLHRQCVRRVLHTRPKFIKKQLLKYYSYAQTCRRVSKQPQNSKRERFYNKLSTFIKSLERTSLRKFNATRCEFTAVKKSAPINARKYKKFSNQWNFWFNSRAKISGQMIHRSALKMRFTCQRDAQTEHNETLLQGLKDIYIWQQSIS